MMTWSLALRNLIRNRRRSLSTLLALAIGAASILIFGGYSVNIKYTMHTGYVRNGGHLQIQHRDFYLYGSGNPTAYGIADYERVLKLIRDDVILKPMVIVATPTLQFGGVAGNFAVGVSRTVIGTGFVAADVNRMRQWNDFGLPFISPHFALQGAAPDAAIVGIGLARVLQLCAALKVPDCPSPVVEDQVTGAALPKDIAQLAALDGSTGQQTSLEQNRIELLAGNAKGTPNVAALTVLQAEGQGFKEFDEVAVILQLAQAQQLVYGRAQAKASSIMVQLHRSDQRHEATARLDILLAGLASKQPLAVLDFETLNPFYVQTIQLFDTIFGFIFVLIGSIVLFTVSNTMNTAVVERTVEIGTLRAVGLRQSGIRHLFVIEGFLLGASGAVAGALIALLTAAVVNNLHLTWLPPGSSAPLPLILRIWDEPRMLAGTTLGLVIIAALSAWWPAYQAARLKVVDALRHA